jgi:sugar phosphate isomerase/epimerase
MLGDDWQGKVTDLLDWIAAAGYEGIEITGNMIGEFADRPEEFVAEALGRGVKPCAFAYGRPSGFTDAGVLAEDLEGVRKWADFAAHFPGGAAGGPILGLGGAASPFRDALWAKLDQALAFYSKAGEIAAAADVRACVHPHSHFGSLLESAEEYEYLLTRLDPATVNFCPDTGHIVRGGQDLLECIERNLPRTIHVHLKDANEAREWVGLGQGKCDFPGVMALLEQAGYRGWVVGEEESADARADGVAAIRTNRAYLRSIGY